jgi:Cupin domain
MFEIRVVTVAPGRERRYAETEWRDALVVVEHGEVELETEDDARWRFGRGDMLWLAGLPLRAVRNRGAEPARLVAVSRLPQRTV